MRTLSRTLILCVLVYSLALVLSINGSSLWMDEAFSAWLASHQSLSAFFSSLIRGDSSDLQMSLYYLYLYLWAKLLGTGEYALRAANIPFILIFSFSLIWTSFNIFRSRIAWLAPALLPFVWHYAAEARPYMSMLAFGAAATAALLAFLKSLGDTSNPRSSEFPWLCLACILVGTCFDMLFLLLLPPLFLMAWLAWRRDPEAPGWRAWIRPLQVFTMPFAALAAFLAFTFFRGTAYGYPNPGLRQMGAAVFELSGLAGFGPNRKFSLDVRPWLIPLACGGLCLSLGACFAVVAGRRTWHKTRFLPQLCAAACLALLEILTLAFVLRKQFDARHLAAIVPLALFLLVAAMARRSRPALASLTLLAVGWLAADLRNAVLPEYRKEDFRDAVAAALSIHQRTGATIVLAADPVGAAYYGMNVEGEPCSPFRQDCATAFETVPWRREAPALEAERWPRWRIEEWLENQKRQGKPVLVMLERDRAHTDSAWWALINSKAGAATPLARVHGFDLDVLN